MGKRKFEWEGIMKKIESVYFELLEKKKRLRVILFSKTVVFIFQERLRSSELVLCFHRGILYRNGSQVLE